MKRVKEIEIAKQKFQAGKNEQLRINVGRLTSGNMIYLQGYVFRSKKPGPITLLLAGVHGDEINGIEIIRRAIDKKVFDDVKKGTIIVIPIVNVFGFINSDRYVPDGKDVNRSFPGSLTGSLASRIARTLTKYVFPHVDYIMDFHTGGDLRYNYPQVRYSKNDKKAYQIAKIFNAPYSIESGNIPKTLRKTAQTLSIPTIIYEGGESFRINPEVIKEGIAGLYRCLNHLGYISNDYVLSPDHENIELKKTNWIRATYSGIFIINRRSGEYIEKGQILGTINDPYGQKTKAIIAKNPGHIIGHNNASVVNYGDALFHIGI